MVDYSRERQEKTGCSPDVIVQTLKSLDSQTNSFQNSLDICMGSLATPTSVENIAQDLRDVQLEAAYDRNAQTNLNCDRMDILTRSFDPTISQKTLESISLVHSKTKDQTAPSATITADNTTLSNLVAAPYPSAYPRLSAHDQSATRRVEDQLATQIHLLLLLTERDLRPPSSNSLLREEFNGII